MRSLSALLFLYFAVPGSGELAWDGIPFSSRAEFVTFVILVVSCFSTGPRDAIRQALARRTLSGAVKPILITLCALKLLSFAWSPLSAGFGSCYRSMYWPLDDPLACEKSFESPFIGDHKSEEARISRVDATVDFGRNQFDWRLPFMNESNRIGALWLKRIPFSAEFRARIERDGDQAKFLPIRSIGELTVSLDGEWVTSVKNYTREFLTVIPLENSTSNLTVKFRYTDDDSSVIPDVAPTPRGPYAQLKVGEPIGASELISKSSLVISGTEKSPLGSAQLSSLKVRDAAGHVINSVSRTRRVDGLRDDAWIEIPATALTTSPLSVHYLTDGREQVLARVSVTHNNPFAVRVSHVGSSDLRLAAHLSIERSLIRAMKPGPISSSNSVLVLARLILDSSSLVIIVTITGLLLRFLGKALIGLLLITGVVWFTVNPFYKLLPSIFGGGKELVIPYALLSIGVVATRRFIVKSPLVFALPTAAVLATQKAFDHLYFNHPGEGDDWWGNLIFLWRDSDWFTNHGNARSVFTDSFLKGGESVFFVRMAPRYLIFLAQLLLGENDILLGLISLSVGFLVVLLLAARSSSIGTEWHEKLLGVVVAFIGLIFIGDQTITAFGFLVSSEFTAWVGILGLSAFLIGREPETRVWVTSVLSAVLASLVHFRPNMVFVFAAFLVLLLGRIRGQRTQKLVHQSAWLVAAFLAILPLSLIHNLYYGARFVPFTESSVLSVGILTRFNWGDLFRSMSYSESVGVLWDQLAFLMYWNKPHDPSLAIVFWGSQILLLVALVLRHKFGELITGRSLIALLPLTYIIPMLGFLLTSYFPRHLVGANLLCLCSALLIWPMRRRATAASI